MQEAQCFRGLFSNRLVGEWTYLLGLAAGRYRGVGWGAGARVGRSGADDRPPKRAALNRARLWLLPRSFVGIFPQIWKDPLRLL
jgi:hypothetical protein